MEGYWILAFSFCMTYNNIVMRSNLLIFCQSSEAGKLTLDLSNK